MRRGIAVIAGAVAAVVPVPNSVVERVYSNGIYIVLQPSLTGASNQVNFALFDLLIVASLVLLASTVAVALWRRPRGWLRTLGDSLLSIAAAGAILYLAFLSLWGLNYRRVPLVEKLDFDGGRVSSDSADRWTHDAVETLNRLYSPAHQEGWATDRLIDPRLADGFADVQRQLGATRLARPGRPKLTLLEPYFRRASVSGMTDPFFLETLVDGTLLPFERPFVVAHEWAHLAGYADEGEASFVGWLTCLRARESEQYSAWLSLYSELARSGRRDANGEVLSEGVRDDLRAVAARLRREVNPTIALAGWRAYDQYLKANRVSEGAASYETVVRLVIGTAFGPGWTPRLRKNGPGKMGTG